MSGGHMITDAAEIALIDESIAKQPKTTAKGASALLPKLALFSAFTKSLSTEFREFSRDRRALSPGIQPD
jgi:hypothetical protein